jgi:hypothetical protein
LEPVAPALFIATPVDRVSKAKEDVLDPDTFIDAVAEVYDPDATLVTIKESPPCSK